MVIKIQLHYFIRKKPCICSIGMLKRGDFDEWKRLEEIQSVTMNMQTHTRLQFEQYIIRELVFFVQKLEKNM